MEKHRPELEFVTAGEDILRILIHSKEFGNVVGITSPVLGSGVFMTAVEKVILDYEVVIQLKAEDVTGKHLVNSTLRLSEITIACAFKSKFDKIYQARVEPAQVGVYSY